MDGVTQSNLSLTERLADLFGKKTEVVQDLTDRAGNALGIVDDVRSGKVLVSSGQDGFAARSRLIAGDMTESLRKTGQYGAFRDAVLKSIPEDELAASVNKLKSIYGSNNPALIEREVVNEWVSNNLYNSSVIKQIASVDPSLAAGVREYLGGLKTKLGDMGGMQAVEKEIGQAEGMWERAGIHSKNDVMSGLSASDESFIPNDDEFFIANTKMAEGRDHGPYSHIKDSKSVGPGKKTTSAQRRKIIDENMKKNNGVVKSDLSGKMLVKPQKSVSDITPDPNEWAIDHIVPRTKGGSNSYSNLQVLSREENRIKWDR